MVRVPTVHVRATRRMILGAIVPLLAVALMGFLVPPAAAAPAAPYFGPATIVDGPPAYWAAEPSLAVDPVNPHLVHVVWTDTRSGVFGPDIFYANSTDGGLSFNPSARVNNDAGASEQGVPAIAVALNEDVYVVWRDPRTPAKGPDIYFSKSSDRGATWTPSFNINDDSGSANQQDPTIAVDVSGNIYVAWTDSRNANSQPDIYATRSTNAGASFAANVKVNDDLGAAIQWVPSLAANGGKIVTAWADSRTSGSTSWDSYESSSSDGLTWSPNVKVNDDSLPNFQVSPI